MSDGVVHAYDSLAIAGVGMALVLARNGPPQTALLFAGGAAAGVLLSPDLDADHRTISEILVWRLFKPLGFAWQVLWYAYALAIPHRHWLSHTPVLGTAGRVGYLLGLWWLLARHTAVPFDLQPLMRPEVIIIAAGLAASDLAHWLRDGAGRKRRRGRRWRSTRIVEDAARV